MRILFLTDKYWPSLGGIETAVRTLAGGLVERGHQVRVATVSNQREPLTFATYTYAATRPHSYEDGTIPVEVLGARPWQRVVLLPVAMRYVPYLRSRFFGRLAQLTLPAYRLAHLRRLTALAAGSDLVHCHGAQYLGACGLAAARRAGKPFVITPHCHPGHWGDDPMNTAIYRQADLVLGVNAMDANTYRQLGVASERVEVVHNPLGPPLPAPAHIEPEPYILYVGRVNSYKGIRRLFTAWEKVREVVSARLLVAGAIQEPELDPPPGAYLLGPVSEIRKAALLSGARALVLPSRGELQGIVVLEAWQRGVPVVVSDIPVLAEVVHNGVDGIVTHTDPQSLSSALIRLLRDPMAASRMGEAGRHRITEYQSDVVTCRLLSLYRRLALPFRLLPGREQLSEDQGGIYSPPPSLPHQGGGRS